MLAFCAGIKCMMYAYWFYNTDDDDDVAYTPYCNYNEINNDSTVPIRDSLYNLWFHLLTFQSLQTALHKQDTP